MDAIGGPGGTLNLKREQERERGYRKGEGGRKSLIAKGGRSKSGRRRSDSREV